MVPTRAYFPTSLRNERNEIPLNQSRLLTTRTSGGAALAEAEAEAEAEEGDSDDDPATRLSLLRWRMVLRRRPMAARETGFRYSASYQPLSFILTQGARDRWILAFESHPVS